MAAMTKEAYEFQRKRILTDERYTPALKQWALQELDRIYKKGQEQQKEAEAKNDGQSEKRP